mmetsp:Transcript_6388/g.21367  ORF Transcript_6388/g.21367 Transcript_6388/m.21367 type:complete len:495 (+) Transcript_6388:394-1878(+)
MRLTMRRTRGRRWRWKSSVYWGRHCLLLFTSTLRFRLVCFASPLVRPALFLLVFSRLSLRVRVVRFGPVDVDASLDERELGGAPRREHAREPLEHGRLLERELVELAPHLRLDRLDPRHVVLAHERGGAPDPPRACRAPDPVDVVFRRRGYVVVDDLVDSGDVEPARGDVGGEENGDGARLEPLERLEPILLLELRVQRNHGHAELRERRAQNLRRARAPDKDDHAAELARLEYLCTEEVREVHLFDFGGDEEVFLPELLRRDGCPRRARGVGVGVRVKVERAPARGCTGVGDGARHCGGEHERLPLRRERARERGELGREARVEEAVSLVENKEAAAVERTRRRSRPSLVRLEVVPQTAWRRHHDVRAPRKSSCLLLRVLPADENEHIESESSPKSFELLANLESQLARRSEHRREHAERVGRERVEDGQRERGCLTRPRLSTADHVATADRRGYARALDGRGRRQAQPRDVPLQPRAEPEPGPFLRARVLLL